MFNSVTSSSNVYTHVHLHVNLIHMYLQVGWSPCTSQQICRSSNELPTDRFFASWVVHHVRTYIRTLQVQLQLVCTSYQRFFASWVFHHVHTYLAGPTPLQTCMYVVVTTVLCKLGCPPCTYLAGPTPMQTCVRMY